MAFKQGITEAEQKAAIGALEDVIKVGAAGAVTAKLAETRNAHPDFDINTGYFLHFAVTENKPWAIQELVAGGADANKKKPAFAALAPLHLAAILGHKEVVEALLTIPGINLSENVLYKRSKIAVQTPETAAEIARDKGHTEIAEAIEAAIAAKKETIRITLPPKPLEPAIDDQNKPKKETAKLNIPALPKAKVRVQQIAPPADGIYRVEGPSGTKYELREPFKLKNVNAQDWEAVLSALPDDAKSITIADSVLDAKAVQVIATRIAKFSKLEQLSIYSNENSHGLDEIISQVAHPNNNVKATLKSLTVQSGGLSEDATKALENLANLESLNISFNDKAGPAIPPLIKKLTNLKALDIGKTGLTDDIAGGLSAAVESSRNLKTLSIHSSPNEVQQAVLGVVKTQPKITYLRLGDVTTLVEQVAETLEARPKKPQLTLEISIHSKLTEVELIKLDQAAQKNGHVVKFATIEKNFEEEVAQAYAELDQVRPKMSWAKTAAVFVASAAVTYGVTRASFKPSEGPAAQIKNLEAKVEAAVAENTDLRHSLEELPQAIATKAKDSGQFSQRQIGVAAGMVQIATKEILERK